MAMIRTFARTRAAPVACAFRGHYAAAVMRTCRKAVWVIDAGLGSEILLLGIYFGEWLSTVSRWLRVPGSFVGDFSCSVSCLSLVKSGVVIPSSVGSMCLAV